MKVSSVSTSAGVIVQACENGMANDLPLHSLSATVGGELTPSRFIVKVKVDDKFPAGSRVVLSSVMITERVYVPISAFVNEPILSTILPVAALIKTQS